MPSSLGPAEIIVILVVALIVLGPKRLPEAGRQVGKALSEIRRWTADMKSEVTSAFDADQAIQPQPQAQVADGAPPVTAADVTAADGAPPGVAPPAPAPEAAMPTREDAAPPEVPPAL